MKKVVIVIVVFFFVFSIYFNQQISTPNKNDFGDKKFIIEKGQGIDQIADNLKDQGFLKRKFWFKVYVASSGNKSNFLDGEFDLKTNLNIKQLTEILTRKENIDNKEVDITLLEGWSIKQMDEYLVSKELIQSGELIDYTKNFDDKSYFFLIDKPKKTTLEGYLYPDTYRVYKNTEVAGIVKKMLVNFDQKLTDEMRADIKKQNKSIFEVLTLASIVEKEMFGYENRQKVADIFLKRIKIGMALQSDATVNYITQKGIASPSLDDINIDNLYNTYKYKGLPPGPICNPSIESTKAVIYPNKTDYWYFLTTATGEIIYSKTHDEHVANKFKYLK